MPQQKLTIIPVTLYPELENSSIAETEGHHINTCTIKTATAEISFCNGVDERIIQTILKELNKL